MFPRRISRRMLLRGGAGVAIGLPLLDAMRAEAQLALPARFILTYMGTCTGGVPLTNPVATGPFVAPLPASFAALQPVAQHVSIISGLAYPTYNPNLGQVATVPGSAITAQHGGTMSPAVSGVSAQEAVAPNVRGHSADQVAADFLGAGTSIPSLQLRVQAAAYNNNTGASAQQRSISVRKSGPVLSELTPNESPLRLYNRLFGVRPFNGGASLATQKRVSALDAVLGDANRLSRSVGADDRARLDQHFTHIRELEQSLGGSGAGGGGGGGGSAAGGGAGATGGGGMAMGGGAAGGGAGGGFAGGSSGGGSSGGGSAGGGSASTGGGGATGGGATGGGSGTTGPGGACIGLRNPGADPAVTYGFGSWSDETVRGQNMADMITYALACDMTRAVAWMFTHDQCWLNSQQTSGSTLAGQGGPPDIHNDSHFALADVKARNANWGSALFGRLVANLAARSEGAGTLLDRTFLSMVFAEGIAPHNKNNLTFAVAGFPSRIRNGVHLATNGAHPAQVQIAGLQAIGMSTTQLGEISGALPGLVI